MNHKRRMKKKQDCDRYFDGRPHSDFNEDKPALNVNYLGSKRHPVARKIRLPQTSDAQFDLQAERAEREFLERNNSDKTTTPRASRRGPHWATKKLRKK